MLKPLRVLFVEDREKDFELLMLELRRGGFAVTQERVETPEAFVAALGRQGWDLILCDYTLPRFSALAALALVKEMQIDLPFIVCSGTVSEASAVGALRAGANDFMVKSKLSRLLPAIDRELRDAGSRAERTRMEAEAIRARTENLAKSAFLANVSHELRTPLNAILGFAELLEERAGPSLDERQRSWLGNIQTAGAHLLDLINDVLDLAKVEAGRYELRPEQLTLAELLAPVLATARQEADRRGLAFDASDEPAITVFLDPLRTRQILHNLLSNALKFTDRGGHVRLATGLAGTELRFVVSDTGIGIATADQGRVFGVFERLHEGRNDATGTGLGLAVTKRFVELQGGSIAFTSAEGVGTTFTVTLPGAVPAAMVGRRVLIFVGDPGDAELVAALAAETGLPVECAVTGATALATIRRDPPAGIVLDLQHPDMRGEAVLEALQADSATRHIPVIAMTVEDDESRSQLLGAADHLTKPIDPARLRRWLDQVADGTQGGG